MTSLCYAFQTSFLLLFLKIGSIDKCKKCFTFFDEGFPKSQLNISLVQSHSTAVNFNLKPIQDVSTSPFRPRTRSSPR